MIRTRAYRASEIAKIVDGELVGEDTLIDKISTDTREEWLDGICFFALSGDTFNGSDFIELAVKKGVKLIVTQKIVQCNAPVIYVKDARIAFLKLAGDNIGKTKIIGVTGSVGKTTVKEMIKSVLSKKYKVCGTLDNHNNEIGVAQALFSITDEDFCVLEMGMRKRGEIDLLASVSKPFVSVIVNAGNAHLEKLGSEEEIFKAKCEILSHTQEYSILPSENRFKELDLGDVAPIFIGESGDIFLEDILFETDGITYRARDKLFNTDFTVKIESLFAHNCTNSLIAYCIGRLFDIPLESIQKGILEFKNCKNRENVFKLDKITIIDDCYNSSYNSLKSALKALIQYSQLERKPSYAIIGDMLEIGENSKKYHEKIGEFARKIGVKKLYCYGEFSRYIYKGFKGGQEFFSKESLIDAFLSDIGKNDGVVLVKASRGMEFEKIIEILKERINEG